MDGVTQREVAQLFCRFSTDEVGQREVQLRQDIEAKQLQLRRLVGERYRDLVESAEVLKAMQQTSRQVTTTIELTRSQLKQRSSAAVFGREKEWQEGQQVGYLVGLEAQAWRQVGRGLWGPVVQQVQQAQQQARTLATDIPLLRQTSLVQGTLLEALREAAREELRRPQLLTPQLHAQLDQVFEEPQKELLQGRVAAFGTCLKKAEEGWLATAIELIKESCVLEGYLPACTEICASDFPQESDLNWHLESLQLVAASGAEVRLLHTPLINQTKKLITSQVSVEDCVSVEEAETRITQWFEQTSVPDGELALHAQQAVGHAVKQLAAKWNQTAEENWEKLVQQPNGLRETASRLSNLHNSVMLTRLVGGGGAAGSRALSRAAMATLLKAQEGAPLAVKWWTAWSFVVTRNLPVSTAASENMAALNTAAGGGSSSDGSYPQWPSQSALAPVLKICELIAEAGPHQPAWLPHLLAYLTSQRLAGAFSASEFSSQLHLDLLFLDGALAAAEVSEASKQALKELKLVESIPQELDLRPFRTLAQKVIEAADRIEAAYSILNGPKRVQSTLSYTGSLLRPLLQSVPAPPSILPGEVSSLRTPTKSTYPFRTLPLASRQLQVESGAKYDEDELDDDSKKSASLFSRLGSQLW